MQHAVLVASGEHPMVASINPVLHRGTATPFVRVCSSDDGARVLGSASDDAVASALLDAATAVVPWATRARPVHVHRWPEALPRFPVGALQAMRRRGPLGGDRLVFAGDYLGGPSLEGAFSSGRRAAERLAADLSAGRWGPGERTPPSSE